MSCSKINKMVQCYLYDEIIDTLSELDKIKIHRLTKIAEFIALPYKKDPEDLLHDVIDKLLSGKRKWPKNLDLYIFFTNTMKSIVSNEEKKEKDDLPLQTTNSNGDEIINIIADNRINIAQDVIKEQELTEIQNLFTDDEIAQEIIIGSFENLKNKELKELTGLTDTEYNSKIRKIRRRISKSYPGGLKNG